MTLIVPFLFEDKTMDEITSSFLTALDELNVLTSTSYYMADNGDTAAQINQVTDDVLSFLINAYKLGIANASIMLDYSLSVNVNLMEYAIYQTIDGKDFADRVAAHVIARDLQGLQTLVESEYHRVYNAAVHDGATTYVDEGNLGVSKTWYTVRDDKVRETHSYLEGRTVSLEEEFFTFDGDHAPYPGGFTKAENNVNCRCIVKLQPG
jgi:hypothetical protein